MMRTDCIIWLRHAAYGLYHIQSLEESREGGYLYDVLDDFNQQLVEGNLHKVIESLKWALKRESMDWEEILPNLPHTDLFKRQHLEITLARLVKRMIGQP